MCDWSWCESLGFQSDCTSLLPEVQLTLIWPAPPLIPHRSPLPCRIELWFVTWQSLSGGVGSSSHKMLGTKRFMRRCPNRWGGGCSHFCLIILGWQLTRFGQFKLSWDDCLKGGMCLPIRGMLELTCVSSGRRWFTCVLWATGTLLYMTVMFLRKEHLYNMIFLPAERTCGYWAVSKAVEEQLDMLCSLLPLP